MLVIVIDHEHSFVGSRFISSPLSQKEIEEYLNREFPNIQQDAVLFIEDDTIIAEWLNVSSHRTY